MHHVQKEIATHWDRNRCTKSAKQYEFLTAIWLYKFFDRTARDMTGKDVENRRSRIRKRGKPDSSLITHRLNAYAVHSTVCSALMCIVWNNAHGVSGLWMSPWAEGLSISYIIKRAITILFSVNFQLGRSGLLSSLIRFQRRSLGRNML